MKPKIVQMAEDADEFVKLEDGFVYYWPNKPGAITAHELRFLADELDNRNAEYVKELIEYFGDKED